MARFVSVDASTTRLELDHWGWELFGDRAEELEEDYRSGWDVVLGSFVSAAASEA